MKLLQHISFIIIAILIALSSFSQVERKPNSLLAKNMEDGTVFLKWVCEKVYYKEGFNVYRKTENSDWQKLNNSPLLWNDTEIVRIAQSSPDVTMFNGVFQKISVAEFQESVASVFALQKAFKNNEFALAIAVGFIDENPLSGTTYTYKLNAIENGQEVEMDQLQITAGNYENVAPPQNIIVDRKKRKINFNFQTEPLRYFGIKILRTGSDGSNDTITGKETYPVQQDIDENGKMLPWPKHLFIDRNIDKDLSYTYQFFAIDYFAEMSPSTGEIKSNSIDFDPPQEAFGLDFKIDTQRITLTWILVDDPDRVGINVYRYNDPNGDSIKLNLTPINKNKLSFEDNVSEFRTYFYKVGVFDAAGNEIISTPTMIQVRDIIPPLPPTGLKTSTDTGMVNLSWKASKEKDLKGYVIYKVIDNGTNNDEEYTMVNPSTINGTNYTERMSKNVKNTFHYVVVAVDTSWNYSNYSVLSIAELPDHVPPVKPFIKIIKKTEKAILITWIPNKDEDLRGYNIFRKVVGDTSNNLEKLNGRPINISYSSYEDKLFEAGTLYSYLLQATDSSNNKSELSEAFQIQTSGTRKEETIELKSFSVKKKRRGKIVSLKWTAAPEEFIEGYVLYRTIKSEKRLEPYTGLLNNTTFNDKSITEGTSYKYQLRLYSKAGDVVRSKIIDVKIPEDK
ncbi:MAG: fibronectin type III domain-containing protein [Salibacteraceae bacterium]|nr:fibronectin type III domain-containing protein [Salibacteraceae bacterium]